MAALPQCTQTLYPQFFITLDRADGLDRKHTIFGRIAGALMHSTYRTRPHTHSGDTIYNVAAMGELEIDDEDRPLNPPLLKGAEVLWNPFPDIVPRITAEQRQAAAQEAAAKRAAAEKGRRWKRWLVSGCGVVLPLTVCSHG